LKKEIVMKKNGFGLYVAVFCILLAGQVLAQTATTPLEGWQRSSQISGMTVTNAQGEKLGKIDDLLIDQGGALKYAILSHGGILGIGDKLIAIPWKALRLGTEKKTLVINVDKVALEKAPNFDPKEWPKVTDPETLKKIDLYYNK
jgi:sporulation protein YlmC with PRC-barrel domain